MPDQPLLSPSRLRRGARETVGAGARSLRALDRDRWAALAASVAMLLVLLAPWYEIGATARAAGGARPALRQSLSGWEALSASSVVCALAAVGIVGWLLVRSATVLGGLGADGRRAARARVDGVLIAGAGGLAALLTLISLVDHPAPRAAIAGVTGATSIRYGLGLALLVGLAIAGLGTRIALLADGAAPRRDRPPGPAAAPRHRSRPRARQRPGMPTPPDATPAAGAGEDLPQFDFVVSRPPAARRTRTARSRPR